MFYGGESIGIQGVIGKIKPLLTETPDMPVIIQGDQESSHGTVQKVHGQAMLAGAQKDKLLPLWFGLLLLFRLCLPGR